VIVRAEAAYLREQNSRLKTKSQLNTCVKRHMATNQALSFLINHCDRMVYVSIVEFSFLEGQKWCTVFGLQGKDYGKSYSAGEGYDWYSMKVSSSTDAALKHCGRSGYNTTDRSHGHFMQLTRDDSD